VSARLRHRGLALYPVLVLVVYVVWYLSLPTYVCWSEGVCRIRVVPHLWQRSFWRPLASIERRLVLRDPRYGAFNLGFCYNGARDLEGWYASEQEMPLFWEAYELARTRAGQPSWRTRRDWP
jgi:hypothetical protein